MYIAILTFLLYTNFLFNCLISHASYRSLYYTFLSMCLKLSRSQFGAKKFGLVHCMYELYGSGYAANLLTALGCLFTNYLQTHHGFTCGIDDLLVKNFAEIERCKEI